MKDNKKVLYKLGKRITEERIKRGYTLEEFAIKAQIRPTYMKKIEQGIAVKMNTWHYFLICEALGIKFYELAKGLD